MLNFKRISCGFVLLAILLTASGCSENDSSQTSTPQTIKTDVSQYYGGVYRSPLANNPTTLDPARIEDIYGISVAQQLFDGLVQFGPYLSILPAVAENWQVDDNGRTIRFFLRPNVIFHHGRQVTSRDVVFSLKRLLRIKPAPFIAPHLLKIVGAQAYRDKISEEIAGLVAVDDRTLKIRLLEPYAPLLGALAMYQAAIVPEEVVVREGENFGRVPVGCGPFRFADWRNDQSILLERHKDYYAGPAYLDKIHYQIFPGVQLDHILKAFKDQQLHEMPVYGAVRRQLADTKNLQWIHRPSLSLLYYGINTQHPELKDPRLRKALALAIDRKKMVDIVYKGQFEPAHSVLPPGMPAYNRQANLVAEDMTEARKLVSQVKASQSNWSPVIEIVSASKSAFAQAELDFVSKAWADLGIKTKKKFITEWPKFESYIASDALQFYRYSWTADIPDPDNFLYPLFGAASPVNRTRYRDAKIEKLLKQASGTVDPVQRAQLYQEIEKKVMLAYPIIPLFYLSIDRVYQPDVKGIQSSALGAHTVRLHRVWLSSPYH